MRVSEVLFVYLCIGLGLAVIAPRSRRVLTVLVWPLVLPSLLAPSDARFDTAPAPQPPARIDDAIGRLREVLGRWQPDVPLPSLDAMRAALVDLDRRRAELTTLLARPEYRDPGEGRGGEAVEQHRANLAALASLREKLEGELDAALARIDELVTRIMLAQFSGQPVGDLSQQLSALAKAIEGLRSAQAELDGR